MGPTKSVILSGKCEGNKLRRPLIRSDLSLEGNWYISLHSICFVVSVDEEGKKLTCDVNKLISISTNVVKENHLNTSPTENSGSEELVETILKTIHLKMKTKDIICLNFEPHWFKVTQKQEYLDVSLFDPFNYNPFVDNVTLNMHFLLQKQ